MITRMNGLSLSSWLDLTWLGSTTPNVTQSISQSLISWAYNNFRTPTWMYSSSSAILFLSLCLSASFPSLSPFQALKPCRWVKVPPVVWKWNEMSNQRIRIPNLANAHFSFKKLRAFSSAQQLPCLLDTGVSVERSEIEKRRKFPL